LAGVGAHRERKQPVRFHQRRIGGDKDLVGTTGYADADLRARVLIFERREPFLQSLQETQLMRFQRRPRP